MIRPVSVSPELACPAPRSITRKPSGPFRVTEDNVSGARPHLIARRFLGIPELSCKVGEVGLLEVPAERALVDVSFGRSPREPGRHPVVQLCDRASSRTRPVNQDRAGLADPRLRVHSAIRARSSLPPVPLSSGIKHNHGEAAGQSCTSVLSLGSRTRGIARPFSNSALINAAMVGAISRSSSRYARRSLTTFFRVGL